MRPLHDVFRVVTSRGPGQPDWEGTLGLSGAVHELLRDPLVHSFPVFNLVVPLLILCGVLLVSLQVVGPSTGALYQASEPVQVVRLVTSQNDTLCKLIKVGARSRNRALAASRVDVLRVDAALQQS